MALPHRVGWQPKPGAMELLGNAFFTLRECMANRGLRQVEQSAAEQPLAVQERHGGREHDGQRTDTGEPPVRHSGTDGTGIQEKREGGCQQPSLHTWEPVTSNGTQQHRSDTTFRRATPPIVGLEGEGGAHTTHPSSTPTPWPPGRHPAPKLHGRGPTGPPTPRLYPHPGTGGQPRDAARRQVSEAWGVTPENKEHHETKRCKVLRPQLLRKVAIQNEDTKRRHLRRDSPSCTHP